MKILITEDQYHKIIKRFVDLELSKLEKRKFPFFTSSVFYCGRNFNPDAGDNSASLYFQYIVSNKHLYVTANLFNEMFPTENKIIKKYIIDWVGESIPYEVDKIYFE